MELFKGHLIGSIVAFILVIAVIAGMVIALRNTGAPAGPPQLPNFPNTNVTAPPALAKALAQPGQQVPTSIAELTQNTLLNSNSFTIKYNGSLYIEPSGIGSLATVYSPMYLELSKYNNETKFSLNATALPVLGVGELAYLNLNNGTFVCTNFNLTAISAQNYESILFGKKGIYCTRPGNAVRINLNGLKSFNLSEIRNAGISLNYKNSYQSVYKNIPCTYVYGLLNQTAANGTVTGNGKFQMCYSDIYYVPLSISLYFVDKDATLEMTLNETNIGNYSNQSYVEKLPGSITS